MALVRIEPVVTCGVVLAWTAAIGQQTLVDIRASVVPKASSAVSDVACTVDQIGIRNMRATRKLRASVFISCTGVDDFSAESSSKSIATVTLERVDAVVTDRVLILAFTWISAVTV